MNEPVDLLDLPDVLYEADLAKALRTSERQIRRLLQHDGPLPKQMPRIDRRRRWHRDAVLAFMRNQDLKAAAKR